MSPTIVLRHGRPLMAVGAAGGATIITTVLGILVNRIDLGMTLEEAIAAPRASQRNSATTQAEPDFMALPTTPGLETLGQKFAVSDTSPLDPTIKIPLTIGVATGLELLGHGKVLAAGEPSRRGGSAAGVVSPSALAADPARTPSSCTRSGTLDSCCLILCRSPNSRIATPGNGEPNIWGESRGDPREALSTKREPVS
jgi:hypothetical protein